jgi:peptidase E
MKRLILMGGRPWEAPDGGKRLVEVMFRYFPGDVNLAFCNFAQSQTDWPATTERNLSMFKQFKTSGKIESKIMTADNFADTSKWADVIYIPGGNPFTLVDEIQAAGNVNELWDGKVICGGSAGADLFCTNFVYLQEKTFGHGLGWLNLTCVPHWRDAFEDYSQEDWGWAESESLKRFSDTPILCIPEGEFTEFTIK